MLAVVGTSGKAGKRPKVPDGLCPDARWLIRMCLHQEPGHRPTAEKIKNDHLDRIVHGRQRTRAMAMATTHLTSRLLSVPRSAANVHQATVPGVRTCSDVPFGPAVPPGWAFALRPVP